MDAADSAQEFALGRRREDLDGDQMLIFALVRALEIIGEAAGQVTEVTRNSLPHIAWRQIVGMRHRLVHAYFDVDYDRVWDTTAHYVPDLIEQLRNVLQASSNND